MINNKINIGFAAFILFFTLYSQDAQSKLYISANAGICYQKGYVPNNSNSKYSVQLSQYDEFIEILKNKKNKLIKIIENLNPWDGNDLIAFEDFIPSIGDIASDPFVWDIEGEFGMGARNPNSIPTCEKKIAVALKKYNDAIASVFTKSNGFVVSENQDVVIPTTNDENRDISFQPIYLTNIYWPNYKAKVFSGSGLNKDGKIWDVSFQYFASSSLLENVLVQSNINMDSILLSWHEIYDRPTPKDTEYYLSSDIKSSKKQNLTFGISVGYDKTFIKEGKKFGLYTGVDLFADAMPTNCKITPNKDDVIQTEIGVKTHSFGITPFLGIASKDSWMIYGLCGARFSFKKINIKHAADPIYAKSFDLANKKLNKMKLEFDIGLGTNYVLSDKFNIGLRYIHTLKSSMKFKSYDNSDVKLTTNSSRIVASLTYTIN